jgi:predicted nucleotidyltransferase
MSSRRERSRAAVEAVARALGEERGRVVFVGGTVAALFALEGGVDVRPTDDVDCVVDVTTLAEYYAFVDRLRALGFQPCVEEGAPLCRQVVSGVRVDVMGTADTALGPTNRWYAAAVAAADRVLVGAECEVLVIAPLYFVATKLEAFRSRGRGDFVESHDLEDVLTVVAGLAVLRAEIESAASVVARAVRDELAQLARRDAFIEAVWGHFEGDAAGQTRAAKVVAWLRGIESQR